jgi:hypothetical protein
VVDGDHNQAGAVAVLSDLESLQTSYDRRVQPPTGQPVLLEIRPAPLALFEVSKM